MIRILILESVILTLEKSTYGESNDVMQQSGNSSEQIRHERVLIGIGREPLRSVGDGSKTPFKTGCSRWSLGYGRVWVARDCLPVIPTRLGRGRGRGRPCGGDEELEEGAVLGGVDDANGREEGAATTRGKRGGSMTPMDEGGGGPRERGGGRDGRSRLWLAIRNSENDPWELIQEYYVELLHRNVRDKTMQAWVQYKRPVPLWNMLWE